MKVCRAGSGTFSKQRNTTRIPSKIMNILLDPLQRQNLVFQSIVSIRSLIARAEKT